MKKIMLFVLVAVLATAGTGLAAISHEVRPGQTLSDIAEFYYGDPAYAFALAEANTVPDPQHLKSGMWLKIPTLNEIMRTRAERQQALAQATTNSFSQDLTGPAKAGPLCSEKKAAETPAQPAEAPKPQHQVQGRVTQFSGELMKSENFQVAPAPVAPPPVSEKRPEVVAQAPVASAPAMPAPAKAVIPAKPSAEKDDNFVELDLSAGYWTNQKYETEGIWAEAEMLYWFGLGDKNFGLGPIVKYDWGHSKENSDVDWGYTAPGLELGWWQSLSDTDYLLVKPRLTWRMHKSGSDKEDGLMPGYYLEYTHVLGARDSALLASGGWFFENDNYLDARVYWNHKFSSDSEVKLGIGPVFHWGNSWDYTSVSPALTLKLWDRVSLGAVAEFSEEGPAYGAFLMLEFNSSKR